MPASVEFAGKNIEKAVKKACGKLKITEEKLKYDVLSFGSTGIFGLAGTKKAKIRVKLEKQLEATSAEPDNATEGDLENPGKASASEKLADTIDPEPSDTSMPAVLDGSIALGRDILQRIIDGLTSEATISVKEESDRILFNVVGGNAAILIGRRGQTLEAIQSLVEKAVNKNNKNRLRVQIDIAGYLETRRDNLEKLANRLAEKAKRIGKPISLGQMSAADRRIIHLALKDDPDVRTQSRGEGYLKKIVIFPKKNRKQKKQ